MEIAFLFKSLIITYILTVVYLCKSTAKTSSGPDYNSFFGKRSSLDPEFEGLPTHNDVFAVISGESMN